MFCPNCGHQIPDESVFCPDCGQSVQPAQADSAQTGASQTDAGQSQQPPVYNGEPVNQQQTTYQYSVQYTKDTRPMNGLCVAGFVVGIVSVFINFWGIVGVVALILSAAGLSASKRQNQRGKGLGIAGLVLGIIGVVWGLLSMCVCSTSFLAYL